MATSPLTKGGGNGMDEIWDLGSFLGRDRPNMGWRFFAVLVVVFGLLGRGGVDGYPAEDLVKELPRQPSVAFKQYAGYVDVDLNHGKSLFYYFVEAYGDHPEKKPLTLWLNGGPGCSSVGGGAFQEIGPFFPNGDGRSLRLNKKSWNHVSNVLFVESPAGVGWSYSNNKSDYTIGDDKTASDMLKFLLGWFEKFPNYKSRDLFLAGESYAGHYIPQLATVLLDYNKKSSGFKFNVKGLALGNPLLNVKIDASATFEFFWSHGMVSDELHDIYVKECNFSNYVLDTEESTVSKPCEEAMNKAYDVVSDYIDAYDVILDVCFPKIAQQMLRLGKIVTKRSMGIDVCMTPELDFYFNLPEVQKALHANRTNLPYNWSLCSEALDYQIGSDTSMIPVLKEIIKSGIRVWIYSGDQDSIIALIGTRRNARDLADTLNFNITLPYRAWLHKDQVGGWTTEYGNLLTFASIRAASHIAPYSQPSRALELFKAFIHGHRLSNTTSIKDEDL